MKLQKNTPKREIADVGEIRKILGLQFSENNENLADALLHAGYKPLYQYYNTREKYQCNQFIIDFDKAVWKDHTFEVCEIEIVVECDKDISRALDQIKMFADENNIKVEPVEARLDFFRNSKVKLPVINACN